MAKRRNVASSVAWTEAFAGWSRGIGVRASVLTVRLARRLGLSLALLVVICAGTLAQFAAAGLGIAPVASAHAASTQQGKNTYQPTPDRGGKAMYLPGQLHPENTTPAFSPIGRPSAATMKPADLPLDPAKDAHLRGSDQRLEVTVPAGAVTPAVLAQAGGPVHLHIAEIEGPSGGTESHDISLGTYQFTLTGPHGQVAAALAKPVQVTLHLDGWRGAAFVPSQMLLIVNGSVPVRALNGPDGTLAGNRTPSYVRPALDPQAETLTAQMPFSSQCQGSCTGSWNTQSPEAQWSKQVDTSVDLPSGDLTYSYPLDVPAGPGGLTPKLQVTYDNASVTGNHNPVATSGWLGEGWDLSVGSISWGEHNVTGTCNWFNCTQVCLNSPWYDCTEFQDNWQMSDSFGNGGELIPDDTNPNVYPDPWYDDGSQTYALYTAGAMVWHLATNPQIKVVSYNIDPNSQVGQTLRNLFPAQYYPNLPPCFRVFLPNGIMEEFGCTVDSLQFYVNAPAMYTPVNQEPHNFLSNYVYRWDLDMLVDASGNQVHFTYNQRGNEFGNGIPFPIDTELADITYDSPSCHSTTTMCTGSAWQPAVQIIFQTDYAPVRNTGAACPTWTLPGHSQNAQTGYFLNPQTMRCDDVHDLGNANPKGDEAPLLQSLVLLNDVLVQVTTTPSTPSWHTLRDYQLSYEQAPSSTSYPIGGVNANIVDPNTGLSEYVAGYSDLTKIAEVGDDGSTSLPPLSMSYATIDEYYVDSEYKAAPSKNCGPSFNTANCYLWTESFYARYLTELDNGRGWSEAYTWRLARNNTHGVPSGAPENPFACTVGVNGTASGNTCATADDENWSRVVLTQRVASSNTVTSTSSYAYTLTDLTGVECSGCTVGMYWGDQNDGDKLDFYNATYMGFHAVNVTNPDGSLAAYTYYSTLGYGVATSTIATNNCYGFYHPCAVAPWYAPPPNLSTTDALHGQVQEEDDYDTNDTTLLKQTLYQYNVTCPPPGVPASAFNNSNPNAMYAGQDTSQLDFNNPVTACEITTSQVDAYAVDGGAKLSGSHTTTAYSYSYDSNGHLTQSSADTTTTNPGGTPHIVKKTQYVWDDNVTTSATSASGTYLVSVPGIETTEDGSNTVKACTYAGYDGGTPGATGQQSSLTKGLVTRTDQYSTNCTPGSLAGQVSATRTYDANGNLLATEDADALAGITGHTDATDCTFNSVAYSACAVFDSYYAALPVQITNALGQKTYLNYTTDGSNGSSPDATNGWGQWLTVTTDPNLQNTQYAYDALGRLTVVAKPGDTISSPTTSYTYPVTCPTTGASTPCTSLATTQRLSGSTTVTSTTYYDGWGRAVETVTPYSGPTNQHCTFAVQYTEYDPSGRVAFTSDAYFAITLVSQFATTCTPGYLTPNTGEPGTSTTYDGLGRTVTTTDPMKNVTTTSYSAAQPAAGNNISDTATYEATTVIDANGHEHITLSDGFGRTRYVEQFSGTGPYTLYGTTASSYDWLGDVTSVTGPNDYPSNGAGLNSAAQTTTSYDLLGRAQQMSDADLGNGWQYGYDPDGNLLSSMDARGTSGGGAVYANYDGLDRQTTRSINSNGSNPYVTYTYDSAANGNDGVGRLTSEGFTGGTPGDPLSGGYSYSYNGRGQVIAETQTTTENASYTLSTAYNDAGQPTSVTYSDGEVFSPGYNSYGWLTSAVTVPFGGSQVNLLTAIGYSGVGGAAMHPTSATVGNGTYSYSASYDNDVRLSSVSLANGGATLFSSTRTYDNVGNVATVNTTLAAGTDNQAFCYDEQNHLVWAGSTGTPPCTGTPISAGSLTSAQYSLSLSYDAMNRLTYNLAGGGNYQYPNTTGHAATSTVSGGTTEYSASYDAVGDMTCRAPTNATTCTGTVTGQQMTYDGERRMNHWQNTPSNPTSSADYLYDGSGQRVEQVATSGGTSTRVYYVFGGLEEVSASGSSSTLTKYYSAGGLLIGESVGGTISYLASDGLGSVSEALSTSGSVTAAQLYGPYGGVRYSSGTMPTAKGFTGQRADASTSGLDYYGARYYDPVLGQFTSADTKQGPNRFAYVADDPETYIDPSGHACTRVAGQYCGGGGGGGGGGGKNPPPPPPGSKNGDPYGCKSGDSLCVECENNKTCEAQQIGQDGAFEFGVIAGFSALLAAIFGAAPVPIWLKPVFLFLSGLFVAFGAIATFLAVAFSREASHGDEWYSQSQGNLANFLGSIAGLEKAILTIATTIMFVLAVVGVESGVVSAGEAFFGGVVAGGWLGALSLGAIAWSNILQQEQVLGYQTGDTPQIGKGSKRA